MHRKPSQPNQSLEHSLACLFDLVVASDPVGSREMSRRLGMDHTRVNRLLGTLRYLGLAEQTADRKYSPGPALNVLAAMSLRGNRLLKTALPHLERLVAQVGRGVALGVLWRTHVCYLYFGWPGQPVETSIAGANVWPAQISSIGRALLAARGDDETRALFLEQDGPSDAVDVPELLRLLATVRRQGYAVSAIEDNLSVALTVGKPVIAGLAITGKVTQRDIPSLLPLLRATADAITRDLTSMPK